MEDCAAVSLRALGTRAHSATCKLPESWYSRWLIAKPQPSISSICQLPAWEGYANDMQMTPWSEALHYHLPSNHSYCDILL